MMYLILIAASLILLGGFLLLAGFEQKRGLRIAGELRNRLDAKVARAAFIARHVDWGAFVRHLVGTALERVLHDIAHGVLRIVRITERFLTRAVKSLRERRGILAVDDEGEGRTRPVHIALQRMRSALKRARNAARKPVRSLVREKKD